MKAEVFYWNWRESDKSKDVHYSVTGRGTLGDPEGYTWLGSTLVDAGTPEEAADALFERLNLRPTTDTFDVVPLWARRSMSVGDVVVVGERGATEVFVCRPCGWAKVSDMAWLSMMFPGDPRFRAGVQASWDWKAER